MILKHCLNSIRLTLALYTCTLNLGARLYYSISNDFDGSKFYAYPNITASYNISEEALVAYTGIPLYEEQIAALTIIHASSKAWALGHVAEQLLLNMDSGDSKQMAAIASTLLEQLTSAGGAVSPAVKRYVVNLTTEAE